MSVRFCSDDDISHCIDVWKTCFPSDADFAQVYFDEIHKLSKSYVYDYCGISVGYLAEFPFEADIFGKRFVCDYLYGISVLPEFRGRGFMRSLMYEALHDNERIKILIPTVKGLYERYGFTYLTNAVELDIQNPQGDFHECYDIDFLDYVYNKFRSNFDISVVRTRKWWEIILKTALYDGYKVIANEGAYAFYRNGYMSELAYVSEYYRDILPVGNCRLCLPESMVCGISGNGNNYLALMLD